MQNPEMDNGMKRPPMEHLQVQALQANPALMRLLPPEIARQHHVLPISMDGARITLAMAHPEDEAACQVVVAAIGAPACIVQADSQEIDRILDEIWPSNPGQNSLRILAWNPTPTNGAVIQPIAASLAEGLKAELHWLDLPWDGRATVDGILAEATKFQADLVITQNLEPEGLRGWLHSKRLQKLVERLPASLLIARNSHWPLKNLLLVVQDGSERTDAALQWTIRLGRACQAHITVMPLLPPVPRLYGQFLQHNLPALLDANDPLGRKLRWIAHQLSEGDLQGSLKLGEGFPLEQLEGELQASNPGLVLVAAGPGGPVKGWMFGDLVNDLADGLNHNLLIAK